MNFNYTARFSANKAKWKLFDAFLEGLAETYKDEFNNPMYRSGLFIDIVDPDNLNERCYEFYKDVPLYIEKLVRQKLTELFFF